MANGEANRTPDKVTPLRDPNANMIIEVTVRERTFRVTTHAESWRTKDQSERAKWCEDMIQEFNALAFDYREVPK